MAAAQDDATAPTVVSADRYGIGRRKGDHHLRSMMQLGLAMELTLRLFAVILLAILLKQLLFRILMAIVTRWADKDDLG